MIDTHAHVAMAGYDGGTSAVLERARLAGLQHVICIGAGGDLAEAESALAVARQFPGTSAIVGIHPHDAAKVDDALWAGICQLAEAPEVVAVGETGYDFHYMSSPPADQERVFRLHVQLARKLGKPLCIHTRDAEPETLALLREEGATAGVIHCFSGSVALAEGALALGFYLSIPGIVTFKKPGEIPEVVRACPLDRLLLETDSPFLAPMPYRGKRNEPALMVETLRAVAALRGMTADEMAQTSSDNARRLFGERLAVKLGV